jgi:MftR C-terminal domain
MQGRLAQALRERPDGVTALDALREFIVGALSPDSARILRLRIVANDEALQRNERARYAPLEQLMAEAIAEDLHAGPDDIRPQIVAAAIFAAFNTLRDSHSATPPQPFSLEHATAVIDDAMRFLRGGLEALTLR